MRLNDYKLKILINNFSAAMQGSDYYKIKGDKIASIWDQNVERKIGFSSKRFVKERFRIFIS